MSPRKLAFPIHFASCWINDDWVHDSDFHYSQSTLTLETFAREYHLSTRRRNFFPNLNRRYHPRNVYSFCHRTFTIKKIPNLHRLKWRGRGEEEIVIIRLDIYIYRYINRWWKKFASQSELIFSIRPHDGPCREKNPRAQRDTHTRERASPEAVTGGCTHNASASTHVCAEERADAFSRE